MRKIYFPLVLVAGCTLSTSGQTASTPPKPSPITAATPAKAVNSIIDRGTVSGHTYTNKMLGFQIAFPDLWLIAGDDFKAYMKSKGIDLTPKPPKATSPLDQTRMEADFKRLTFLLTAYRSLPGTTQNATVHIAVEDVRRLNTDPPVKDAVDYIDLVRYQLGRVKLPSGYSYSETMAEKLGSNQFAYMDSTDKGVKTRLYVTVRKGYAILFSIIFSADDDLETFRDVLARANFSLK